MGYNTAHKSCIDAICVKTFADMSGSLSARNTYDISYNELMNASNFVDFFKEINKRDEVLKLSGYSERLIFLYNYFCGDNIINNGSIDA